jgi:hypothetical protein
VAEQILYEIGDPQGYMLPDVVCDFTGVEVSALGDQRVLVTGARGRPASGRYKVCLTHTDGWRTFAVTPVVGRDAGRKARRQAEAVLERVGEMLRARNLAPFRATSIEVLGAEMSYGAQARGEGAREVVTKLGIEHDERRALEVFLREWMAPMTSMAVGSTGWFAGLPEIQPVVRVFSFTLDRAEVPAAVSVGDAAIPFDAPRLAAPFDAALVERPIVEPAVLETEDLVAVPLIDIAWARSGDKGDAFNVGVIARDAAFLPYIRAALSEDAVRAFFAHEFAGGAHPRVIRYDVPGLKALNFHCLDALGGGQFASLRLDALAKGKGQQLLEFLVPIPRRLLSSPRANRD